MSLSAHPEKAKINAFLSWYEKELDSEGSKKVEIKWESLANRIIVAKKYIHKDEVVLKIPYDQLITQQYVEEVCEINRICISK